MMEPADRELAADIEATVRAVPGVTEVFRMGGLVPRVIDAGGQTLGIQHDETSHVRVERSADGDRVQVAIGVDSSAGAVETTRRIQAAIGALGAAQGAALTEIRVTVVHIDDTSMKGPSTGR